MDTGEQNLMGKPSQVIRFNKLTGQLEKPTILLKTRGGKTLGELQYTDLDLSFVAKGLDNLSFEVHKIVNGKECKYWDRLTDLCIIEYVGYGQFECHPTINDIDETIKTCVCESLETELGQHTIRDIHINDEDAILYGRKVGNNNLDFDNSGTFIPTVLYDKNDEVHSLLNRVLKEKTPHWTVGYVSSKFAVNGYVYDADQIQRTFTIEGITPYDFFDSDASKEFGCVFTYDTYNRKVNCYNLEDCVYDTSTNEIIEGYYYLDGKYYDENNNEIIGISNLGHCSGIGEDTTIFISKSKLANSFSLDSSKDSIKNCFYVSGGDDAITNIVAAANVTGNNYIYLFGNFQYEDMSEELVQKIEEYSSMLEEMEESFNKVGGVYVHNDIDYTYDTIKKAVVDKNNRIIVTSKYIDEKIYVLDTLAYYENEKCYDREGIELSSTEAIYDKAGLYTEYTNLIDRINYWEHTRFPKVEPVDTTAERQKEILIKHFETDLNPVYIQNGCSSDSFAHVTSNIESVIGVVCDERYTIKILKGDSHTITCDTIDLDNTIGYWNGTISLTRTTNEKDSVEFELDVKVVLAYDTEDCIGFCKQKIDIAIAKMDIKELDFTKLSNEQLEDLISQYNLNSVKSFMEGFDSCRSILNDLYANMELEENQIPLSEAMILSTERYTERYNISKEIYDILFEKIEVMNSQKDLLFTQIDIFRAGLDIKTCFGEELWKEFRSYVREDEYNNGNYISDGLSNCEILEKAKELLDVAKKELSKACVIQKTISGDINNIFSLEEKESLHDKFALFNYVRVCADDNIYKLRLMGISFSEGSPEKLNVTFSEQIEDVSGKKSDVQKILEQSQSIATTYSSTTKQAKQGASAMSNFNTLKQEGLNSSLYLIKNSNTEEVTFGNTGLSCKSMLDNGIYSPYEVRVTHNGIYMSENNFNSVKTALGRFKYNGEWVYGLCTDVLFGDLIIGEKMLISNKNGSVSITGDGITLDGGSITWTSPINQNAVSGLEDTINGLGEQIDGKIDTWNQISDPSSSWSANEKIEHKGDIWYNGTNTKLWSGSVWTVTTDTTLKSLADSKKQVFTTTPTVPYYVGDLWVTSITSNAELKVCKIARTTGSYVSADWVASLKYTDDSTANAAQTTADLAKSVADNAKTIGDNLVNVLGYDGTKITGTYIYSPVISGGTILVGDKNGTYAEITSDGTLNAKGVNISGTITTSNLSVNGGVIQSRNYVQNVSGMKIALSEGTWESAHEDVSVNTITNLKDTFKATLSNGGIIYTGTYGEVYSPYKHGGHILSLDPQYNLLCTTTITNNASGIIISKTGHDVDDEKHTTYIDNQIIIKGDSIALSSTNTEHSQMILDLNAGEAIWENSAYVPTGGEVYAHFYEMGRQITAAVDSVFTTPNKYALFDGGATRTINGFSVYDSNYVQADTSLGAMLISWWASDEQLKKNIAPTCKTNVLDKIKNINFIQFD